MDGAAGPPQPAGHHSLPAHEVVLLLASDPRRGLEAAEVARRRRRFGPNVLPAAKRPGAFGRLGRQLHHPLIYILIASGLTAAALGEHVDAVVILGVVVVNAFVGFAQESKAEAALDSLRSLVSTPARVIRDGTEQTVPSEELVPGDLVSVEAGDRVPADLRLIGQTELRVDESALTGESLPVIKEEVALPPGTLVADRQNMLYAGTVVTGGRGAGVAVTTGAETELGEIHRLVGASEPLKTPLTRKLAEFSRVLTAIILTLAAVTFGVGLARSQDAVDTFTAAIALAVGAIPEGLPAAVTITLAIGVARMAKRRAVVRQLPAVETLGSTTVICTDKTGTLTKNQMTVQTVWTPDGQVDVSGSGYAPHGSLQGVAGPDATAQGSEALGWCLLAGAACNDATLVEEHGGWTIKGDPTEGAMLVVARKAGIDLQEVAQRYPRLATIPFTSERQYMATLHRDRRTGAHLVLAKGSVEQVTSLCGAQYSGAGQPWASGKAAIAQMAEALARRGLRVLATAMNAGADPATFGEGGRGHMLVFTGLQAMMDPPRPAAREAIRACRAAGVSVRMITGDHAATASAIARDLGLPAGTEDVLTGVDLAALSDEAYLRAVGRTSVFARVAPDAKLRLVRALQAQGQVVAMTGDGVNDAPALRQADIGVAMGETGTEVARDAADIVLTDDNFATIEAAVEEGRGVFDNLTKFIVWTLPTNMGEGLVILVAIVLGLPLPILPTQILWINMTTAVALGLMLAFEPKEPGIMARPPRDPHRPLLTAGLAARVLLVSALLVGGAWWLFRWEQAQGSSLAEARTAALNLFVAIEVVYLFGCRSLTRSVWRLGLLSNRALLAGVGLQAAGQLALTYLPAFNAAFQTAPIGPGAWLRIVVLALASAVIVALDKRLHGAPA